MSAAHPSLLAYHNTGLFSDFFLDNRLQDVLGWDRDAADAARTQAILRELFEEARLNLESDANEAQTEHVFVRPVLEEIERLERSTDGAVYDLYELSTAERALVDAEYESPTGAAG